MPVTVWLMLLSVLGVAALFIALVIYLLKIITELEQIGGERRTYGAQSSYLSKIRLGVRAIETQTAALAPQVTTLNTTLTQVRDGVRAIDDNLGGVLAAVAAQENR
jgi:uncharacterized protein YoxC